MRKSFQFNIDELDMIANALSAFDEEDDEMIEEYAALLERIINMQHEMDKK